MLPHIPQNLPLDSQDVIVCGAGPAGLLAALGLAKAGFSVALLDKRDPWREPVSCAEAVNTRLLHKLVEVDPTWVRGSIDGVDFVSPGGHKVRYTQVGAGLILDRARMHHGLAARCAEAGVRCHFRSEVSELLPVQADSRSLILVSEGTKLTVSAKVIVDATGPGGRLTKGEDLVDGRFDLEPAVFALLDGLDHQQNFIQMFFHSKHFPGGYGWLFPRDGKVANVGLVVGRQFARELPPRDLLKRWVSETWPQASIREVFGGAIACGDDRKPLVSQRLIKAGDAANMVNPISRSGIIEAMRGGILAGDCAAMVLRGESESVAAKHYWKEWGRIRGVAHQRLAKAKNGFGTISDAVFDKAAQRILKIPESKRTLPRIFWATLASSPSLLWKMRSLM